VPVEAALGDIERLGERLDPHGVDPARGERLERRRDPDIRIEAGRFFLQFQAGRARHSHT
jgi:hypothetical protein